MKKLVSVALAGGLMFSAAACSDSYGRSDAIDDLTKGGLSEEVANCIADQMEEQDIDFKEANETDQDSELFGQVTDIAIECQS